MSQIWSYDLLIPSRAILSTEELSNIYQLLKNIGFTPVNPVTGKIEVFRVDRKTLESISLNFTDWDAILPQTGVSGNLITIWKGDTDAHLGFNLEGINEEGFLSIKPEGLSRYGVISIAVDDTHYHLDEKNKFKIANDFRDLFIGLCDCFNASYGFSYNEEFIETIQGNVRRNPPILFWLNYISNELSQSVDIKEMLKMGGKISHSSKGAIISYYDYPWEGKLHFLAHLNSIWAKLP
jgi:hypothetical protein